MPYSMDSEENRKNPTTPSPLLNLHEQLIYKIAALDASMQSGFRRLDEKMDRFQSDLHENQLETNDRINKLEGDTRAEFVAERAAVEILNKRLQSVEHWRTVLNTRIAAAGAAALIIWSLVSEPIQNLVHRIFAQ